jgi:hypothetical protein
MEEVVNVRLILVSGRPSRWALGGPHNLLIYIDAHYCLVAAIPNRIL